MSKKIKWYESVIMERFLPVAIAAATLASLYIWRDIITGHFASGNWKNSDLYSAVFGWASIQTGFVFGIYGFVASKTDGFIKQISTDQSFHRFIGYIKRANVAGFLLTFFTLPMIVVSPDLNAPETLGFKTGAVWFAGFIWTFCSFLRVALIFGKMVAVPDRPSSIPG